MLKKSSGTVSARNRLRAATETPFVFKGFSEHRSAAKRSVSRLQGFFITLLAFDGAGNLLIVDNGNSRIRLLSPAGEVSTVAGASRIPERHRHQGNSGSFDGPGNQAVFHSPDGIALDDEGNIFFTESNHAIRMIDSSGFVSAVLRTPRTRYGGALSPFLGGIAVGSDGALYVTDFSYDRVIRVTRDGEISIVADLGFRRPLGIIVTEDGDLLVSDTDKGVIFQITLGDGTGTAAE